MTAKQVRSLLSRYTIPVTRDERELQGHIETILQQEQVRYRREFILYTGDRLDFFVDRSVAIEVKVAGGITPLIEQLQRYALCDEVREILVVSTRPKHRLHLDEIQGKRVECLWIGRDL